MTVQTYTAKKEANKQKTTKPGQPQIPSENYSKKKKLKKKKTEK